MGERKKVGDVGRGIGRGAVVVLLALIAGCGKKAPPLPPIVLYPALVRDLTVRQEGTKFVLYFTPPTANNDGSPLIDLDRIDIYLVTDDRPPPPAPQTQPATQSQPGQTQPAAAPPPPVAPPPLEVTVIDFESRAGVIGTIKAADIDAHRVGIYLSFEDPLERFQPPRGLQKRFTYAVQPFSVKDHGPGFSNRITLDLLALADPPREVKAVVLETGVAVTWTPPTTNIDGTTPPAVVGYNVYRKSSTDRTYPVDPLNPSPYPVPPFLDTTAQFGTTYSYMVRGANTATRPYQETAQSNVVEVTPKDVFPPPPPQNLVAVASKSGINLLWSTTQAKDLAGYRVYRRTEKEKFELLAPDVIAKNTFLDTTAKSKTTYYYVVTSLDRTTPPNESPYSNEAREFMP